MASTRQGRLDFVGFYGFYTITRPSLVALSPSMWKEFNTGFSRSCSERIVFFYAAKYRSRFAPCPILNKYGF